MGAGDHTINITYEGDNNYNKTTKLAKFTVSKNNPNIDLSFNTTEDVGVEVINSIVKGELTSLIVKLPGDAKGYVNVTGKNINILNKELVNGQINITLADLDTSNYNILVSYGGDDKYNNASASIVLVVASGKTSIEISPITTQIVGSNVDVNVQCDAAGNVTLYINGMLFNTTEIVDGWANFTIESISADVNPVNVFVVYESNGQYASAFNSTTFNVEKLNTTISATSDDVNVTVRVLAGASGNVMVTFNGVNYTAVINPDGVAVVSLPKVPGAYTLPVYYIGDDKYNANSTMVDVSIPWGDNYVLNATVDDTGKVTINIDSRATGNVTITCDSNSPENVTMTVDDDIKVGEYLLPADLSVGSHIVTVSYAGDNSLGAKSYSLVYNAPKKISLIKNVTVDSVIDGAKSLVNVTMNGTESGNVIIELDGVNYTVAIKDGHALFEILLDATTSGKVYYLGNDVFAPAVAKTFTAVVNPKADSEVVITTDSLTICESATITATVNGASSDAITYIINGAETDTIDFVVAGTYTVVAVFEGNSTHKASNKTKTFTVEKLDTPITITVDGEYLVNDTINIGVNAPTGAVVTINDIKFDAGKTSYAAGSYTVVAVFEGNSTHKANTTTARFTVNKLDSPVSVNAEEIYKVSDEINIGITTPSGAVITINGGVFDPAKTSYAAGTYTVVVNVIENTTHKANSTTKTFTVEKTDSLINVTVNPVINGTKSLINVTMNSTESGSVIVEINDINYTVAIKDGRALFEILLDSTTSGKVYYLGNDVFAPAVAKTFTAVVNPKADSILVINDPVLNIGSSTTVTASVNGVLSDEVVIVINSIETDTIASVEAITYNVVASFAGNSTHKANTTTKTFTVKNDKESIAITIEGPSQDVLYANPVTVNVSVTTSNNLPFNGLIYLKYNKTKFGVVISDGEGSYTFDANTQFLDKGEYEFIATFEGNNIYNPSESNKITCNVIAKEISEEDILVYFDGSAPDNVTVYIQAPDGIYNVTVDGETVQVNVRDGIGDAEISGLGIGDKTATIAIDDDNYKLTPFTEKFSYFMDADFKTELVKDSIKYGQNATVTILINSTATGNITVYDNDKLYYEFTVAEALNGIDIELLTAGVHEIKLVYSGDDQFANSTCYGWVNVSKIAPTIEVNVSENPKVGDKVTLNVSVDVYEEGNVVIIVDGKEIFKGESDNGGRVSADVSDLTAGNHTYIVTFEGTVNYLSNQSIGTFAVSKNNLGISIVVDNKDSLVAMAYTKLTVTVGDGDASGFILIEGLDAVLYEELENGVYTLNPLVLPAGDYELTVTYLGNDKYNKAVNTLEFKVTQGKATVEITDITTPINVGDDLTFVVSAISDSPNAASGNVTVYVDGVENQVVLLDSEYNNASVTVKGLGNGTHTIGVKYNGNDNFNASDIVTASVSVNKITPTISILVEDDNLKAIAATYVVITVGNGYASGNIVIDGYDGEFTLVDGKFRLQMYDLTAGTYTVNVTYLGDDKYASNKNSISFTVDKGDSVPVISNIDIDEDLSFIVAMDNDAAGGNVTVYVDGVLNQTVTLDSDYANASVTIKGLSKGNHTIGVKYNGNDNFDASMIVNNIVTVNGKVIDPETAFTNPDSNNPETFGIELPSDATGNFTVRVDGKDYASPSLVDGKANVTVSGLSNGSHSIELVYSGDGKYSALGKTQNMVVVNNNSTPSGPVSPGSPDSVFSLPNGTVNPPVFTINLPSDASGNFTVSIGGKDYTVPVENGKASITVSGLSKGDYPIVVSYSGDNHYAGLFKTATVSVPDSTPTPGPTPSGKQSTVLTFAKKKYTFKKSQRSKTKTFKVTLKTKSGAKLAGKTVLLKLTKANKIKLSAKTKKAIKKAKAKVKKAKKAYKKSKTAKAKKALAKAQKALTKAKKPQTMLKQLKKGTYAVKTNKNGLVKLTLSKKSFNMKKFIGKAKLTATFKGDSSYLKSAKTVKIVLK